MTTMVDPVRTHASRSQRGSGGGTTPPTVIGQTFDPGAVLRNNFAGWVGFRFQVGGTRITVTDLGRWVVTGNSGTHLVKLVQISGVDVPGASTTVSASGTPGQYAYASLPTSVTLDAGTTNYLVSQEVVGGDQWYSVPDCHVTLSSAASFNGPAWAYNNSTTYYFAAYADLSYVPVNLKYAGSGTATYSWVPTSETRYLYDGMLVIQERDTNNIPTVSYTRGVDLSGSRQGAGGIGGLLARSEHATYSPYNLTRHDSYHADGNGNITAMVYGGSELSASYQYDPYGRMMATGGTRPTVNLYRFSSKMVLTNSGIYYYGYRFYDPNLQRWPNRDPIFEAGGINLYTFVLNNPLTFVDANGREAGFVYCPDGGMKPPIRCGPRPRNPIDVASGYVGFSDYHIFNPLELSKWFCKTKCNKFVGDCISECPNRPKPLINGRFPTADQWGDEGVSVRGAYSDGFRTRFRRETGQWSDASRTPFRLKSDSVPADIGQF